MRVLHPAQSWLFCGMRMQSPSNSGLLHGDESDGQATTTTMIMVLASINRTTMQATWMRPATMLRFLVILAAMLTFQMMTVRPRRLIVNISPPWGRTCAILISGHFAFIQYRTQSPIVSENRILYMMKNVLSKFACRCCTGLHR